VTLENASDENDPENSKIDSNLTFQESPNFKKQKFGQFWDKNKGIKIQGNFTNNKLDGLGLVIKDSGNGENDADFCFYANGEKVEDVEDDESMFVYDMMYQEFKEECQKAGVIFYQWIEGDGIEDSEIQMRLSRTNLSR
jgi:hypothetical protein